MNILVTGGAGYLGAPLVRALVTARHRVIVLDNLSSGKEDTIPSEVMFVQGDVRDSEDVGALLKAYGIGAIFHLASATETGRSFDDPRRYFRDNLAATIDLMECAIEARVSRFVYASSASVYGMPAHLPIEEEHPANPVHPDGDTKHTVERALANYDRAYNLRFASMRIFNLAGADVPSLLGERHDPETHIIPMAIEAALVGSFSVPVYGDDYPTDDGTPIRDFVHVMDATDAMVAALAYLNAGGASTVFNVGTGRGHSVLEVIDAVERVSGQEVPIRIVARRPGDVPALVASNRRARELLGWVPKRASLQQMVRDAWMLRTHRR